MTGFGYFQASISGLESQGAALSVISGNIANVTTTGFKRSEVAFDTLVSQDYAGDAAQGDGSGSLSVQSDIGGVRTTVLNRVSDQGRLSTTGRSLDLAINGDGLFVYRQGLGTTGGFVYGRDGQFSEAAGPQITVTGDDGQPATANESYLVDKNGYYLQGWAANADGTFPSDPASLGPIRIDPYAFVSQGQATTTASLDLNLPSSDAIGESEQYTLNFFDARGEQHEVTATFTKSATNTWSLQLAGSAGDSVTITPSQPLTFSASGQISGPTSYSLAVTNADNTTTAFTLDVSSMSQYAGPYYVRDYEQNGQAQGSLDSVEFDSKGYLIGQFSNGTTRRLYRLPLADFANTDGLTPLDGTVYAASTKSGAAVLKGAGEGGTGSVMPGSVESSNVNLEDQFSRMIMTQQAYNSAATAFKTMDEMLVTSRDLKR